MASVVLAGGTQPGQAARAPSASIAGVGLGVPPAEAPPAACAAARGRLCGSREVTTAAAGAALLASTRSPALRRGLRLASTKRLFGRRSAAALRRSDARLLGGLARAAKASALQGSGTSSSRRADVAGQLREVSTADSTLRNGRQFQKRSFRLESYVESCPDPRPASSHGAAFVRGVAVYDVVTRMAAAGKRIITTSVHMRVDISQVALTSRRAELWAITNFGNPDKLTIASSQSVLSAHGERQSPSSTLTMELDALSPGTDIAYDTQGLDAFVEKANALDSGDPNPFADKALAGKAYKGIARAFADMVGARVKALAKAAEAGWRTPGKCVRLTLAGRPPVLPPLGISRISGTVAPVRQGVTEAAVLDLSTFDADYINGPGVARAVATLPLEPGEPWFDFTAPRTDWPDASRPGLEVNFYSKGGLGRASITFPGAPDRVTGTFSGDVDLATGPGSVPWQLSWTGNVTADLSSYSTAGTRMYGLTSGSVTVTFHGTGDCELNGTGTFDLLTANAGAHSPVVTVTNGATYTAGLAAPTAQVTVVKSNCTDPTDNGHTFAYPLIMTALIYSATGLAVPSPPVYAGSATGTPTPGDAQYHWHWNLQPG